MRNRDRIQEYALKLAREGKLQYSILVNVATQLHHALITQVFQEIGQQESTYQNFNICPQLIARLEKQFEKYFTSDFWEQNAEWILNHLEAWSQGENRSDIQPEMLAFYPDPSFPKSKAWTESQIISACAYHATNELLHQMTILSTSPDNDFSKPLFCLAFSF